MWPDSFSWRSGGAKLLESWKGGKDGFVGTAKGKGANPMNASKGHPSGHRQLSDMSVVRGTVLSIYVRHGISSAAALTGSLWFKSSRIASPYVNTWYTGCLP